MNNWKNSLSCWCFVYDVLHRALAFCLWMSRFLCFSKSSSLFIEDLRDVENLAVTSTCLVWSFDSSPLILCLIGYLSFEELISNPCHYKRNNVCSNVTVILSWCRDKFAEMVVAEFVVVHFVHRTLSTLVK